MRVGAEVEAKSYTREERQRYREKVRQDLDVFERMLGAGDLLIESGGEDGQQRFTDIRHPDKVQNLVHAQVEALIHHRAGYRAGATTGGGDVTVQLERLEGLLQRGTITQQEFDSQKAKLLG